MALLALQDQAARLTARGGALEVFKADERIATKPLHEIDEVHIYGAIEITAAARLALLGAGVDVLFFTAKGQWRGRLISAESSNAARRMAQYTFIARSPCGECGRAATAGRGEGEPEGFVRTGGVSPLELAAMIVRGKLRNQRAVLARVQRRPPGAEVLGASLAGLRKLMEQIEHAADADALRGLEGYGASLYFRGLSAAILNPLFTFKGRNRRPPKDPINACLSFGYTLLATRVESAVRRAGLDPYLGVLHAPIRGNPALVLDLMEPFRPHIDRLVLRLINRRQLKPEDFINPFAGAERVGAPSAEEVPEAVYLGPEGRGIFLREISALWRQRYAHEGQQQSLTAIMDLQAQALAALFEGRADTFAPVEMD
ncbi:CRISPR-associated endonuclease Cas1 [Myxococcota bacterium]|nr:CRISPR-associated endonuclease Cas1 [Myxococcota bacterium]